MTHDTVTPVQYRTVAEVATTLRLSPMTVYRMVNGGQLEAIRTGVNGRTIRILKSSVDAHLHIPGQTEITE